MVDTSQETAVQTVNTPQGTGVISQANQLLSNVRQMTSQPSFQRSMPAIVAVGVMFFGLLFYLYMQQPARTTLYASLPDSEKSKVVDSLKNMGIDVSLDPATGEVTVPVDDYHRSKISLAAQGLPSSLPNGYETLSELPMGSSRSVEQMRLKQTQELELARSIGEIEGVLAARVHLAMPEKSVFARNQEPPTASVFVQLSQGRTLSQPQVTAILHLVSSSIPNMTKEDVAVIDQMGKLLSQSVDDPDAILTDNQLQHRMRLESIYRSRIVSLVTPIVGPGNITAQVNLAIDFTRSETTEEIVDPNATALRSEQSSMDMSSDSPAKGIPGAVSNTAPTQADLSSSVSISQGKNIRTQSSSDLKNYEVSRRVTATQNPATSINKINAAVLIRDEKVLNEETGQMESSVLTPEKIEEIRGLISSAIGIDDERGDTLTVSSSPFVSSLEGVSKSWYDVPLFKNLIQQSITIIILAIIALGVLRPLLNRILVPVGAGVPGEVVVGMEDELDLDTVEVGEGESLEDIKAKLKPKKATISAEMLDTANTYDDKVAVIRMIVADEAGRVSNVFKNMMQKDIDTM